MKKLDLRQNKALQTIQVENVSLEELLLGDNPSLYRIEAIDTKFTRLDLSGLTSLQHLYVHHGHLASLDVSHNNELVDFYVAFNDFSQICLNATQYQKLITYQLIGGVDPGVEFVVCNSSERKEEEEFSKDPSKVYVYPNPASDMLMVHSTEEVIEITIKDAQGNAVLKGKGTINVSALPRGMYMADIQTQKSKSIAKLTLH